MRRFHRSAAKVKMCRSARLHILGAEAEEHSDEAHYAVLYAVFGDDIRRPKVQGCTLG